MKNENISLIAFMIVGIVMGYASILIGDNWTSLGIATLVFVVMTDLLKRVFGMKEQLKWFLSNGGSIYFFTWLAVWLILYNL
jgi:hypothetical protein